MIKMINLMRMEGKCINPMRIIIFGRPGSGKSTCALSLAQQLNLPLYHLDKYFFTANWAQRDYAEFITIQENIVDQEKWIIDGNSLQSLHIRYWQAEACIYFNFPRWLCLLRLIKRMFTKDPAIKDRADGCKEKISWRLLHYMWTFEYRKNNYLKKQIQMLQEIHPEVQFYQVHNDQELKKVIKHLISSKL